MSETYYKQSKSRVINCIKQNLDLDVSDISIKHVNNFDFYKCIKQNYDLSSESYQDIESIKERYKLLCLIIPGLFKWKDEKIYIKTDSKYDFSLLLVELLHSKSITKGKNWIKKWLSEGLVHYLGKLLCEICNIEYVESGHSDYFVIWEKIHKEYNFEVLKTIIFAEDIKISVGLLKQIFRYNNDDILLLSFDEIVIILNSLNS